MIVYNYHYETREFLSSEEAVENPLEEGKYLIPANATGIEPLEPQEGMAIVFDGAVWEYLPDHRGKVFYTNDRQEVRINDLGDVPDGLHAEMPELTSAEKEAIREAQIQAAFTTESDPLFFKWQAGEIEKKVWLDKRREIKDRFQKTPAE